MSLSCTCCVLSG